ncbi:hypothetical protein [Novosphingobium profundi]|uniref:hypothetical protein n=1 Tax=Novosphingobium profundi TaxID=1774954 RepID=UPI0031BA9BAB
MITSFHALVRSQACRTFNVPFASADLAPTQGNAGSSIRARNSSSSDWIVILFSLLYRPIASSGGGSARSGRVLHVIFVLHLGMPDVAAHEDDDDDGSQDCNDEDSCSGLALLGG